MGAVTAIPELRSPLSGHDVPLSIRRCGALRRQVGDHQGLVAFPSGVRTLRENHEHHAARRSNDLTNPPTYDFTST